MDSTAKSKFVFLDRVIFVPSNTLNSKTFENEDHTFTTSIYMDPVHYLDTDGTWKDATDDLVEAPGIPEPAAGIQVLETENGEKAAPAGR